MKFEIQQARLVSLNDIPTKTGGKMTIATIANTATYETLEAAFAQAQDMAIVKTGKDFKAIVEVGRYNSITLLPGK